MDGQKPSVLVLSSHEALPVARAVQQELYHHHNVELWTQGFFAPSEVTIESLIKKLSSTDFVVALFAPDDALQPKAGAADLRCPRDNVVFETGLAIGILSRQRVFVLCESDPSLKLPSDLSGFNMLSYRRSSDMSIQATVGSATSSIHNATTTLGPRCKSVDDTNVDAISNQYLRALATSILNSAARGIECLTHNVASRRNESDYLDFLSAEIKDLKQGDLLYAICGGKNWNLGQVHRYLNDNVACAQEDRGVTVCRIYVAKDGIFPPEECDVIECHIAWAEKLPTFEAHALVDDAAVDCLRELHLPAGFGMVLTRHSGCWKSRMHYGLNAQEQEGWEFLDRAVIFHQLAVFEKLKRIARNVGYSEPARQAVRDGISRLRHRDPRLWRFNQPRPDELGLEFSD